MDRFSIRDHSCNRTRSRRCIWKNSVRSSWFSNRLLGTGYNLRNVVATLSQFNDPLALYALLKARCSRCYHEGSNGGVVRAVSTMSFALACDTRPFLTSWAFGVIANGCFGWNEGRTGRVVAIGSINCRKFFRLHHKLVVGIRREQELREFKCDDLTAAFRWEIRFVLCCVIEELVDAFAAICMTTWRRHEVPSFMLVSTCHTDLHRSVRAWSLVFRTFFMMIVSLADVLSLGFIEHGRCGGIQRDWNAVKVGGFTVCFKIMTED